MPILSIITINHNNIKGLEKTLLSVFNLTNKNFEYIVIDGGSTDGSVDLLEEYRNQISYLVSEKDNGIYHAMNKGIKAATGDFLVFMNSGDVFYNETIIDTIASELNNSDEIVYGDVLLKNELTGSQNIQIHPEKLTFNYFYQRTICQQACIYKKSLFDKIFFFNEDYRICSDWEFLIYAIFIARVNCRKIDYIISIYDTTGISGNPNFKQIAGSERKKTIEKFFPLFEDDYKLLLKHSSYRSKQLLQIEKSIFFRKIVSVIFIFVLFFIPKEK